MPRQSGGDARQQSGRPWQDVVRAYMWPTLTGQPRQSGGSQNRFIMASRMAAAQIAEIENLALERKPK